MSDLFVLLCSSRLDNRSLSVTSGNRPIGCSATCSARQLCACEGVPLRPFVNNGPFDAEQFTYRPENNTYICPQGKQLTYVGINARNRTHVYASTPKRCRDCSQKAQCTRGQTRILQMHVYAGARQRARERAKTPEFVIALRARKKVEALFAELKNQIGLRRLRLRRMKFVREQFFLAAAAQNLKRLVRFLARTTPPPVEVTA